MPVAATLSDRRLTWIDILRGGSVLLVILAHAHNFAITAAGPESASVQSVFMRGIGLLNGLVGPLRMELMFLLSGLFVARGLRKGKSQYVIGKINNVLYPFVVWALLNFALREAGSVFIKNEPIAWNNLVDLLIGVAPPTWFLFDLFFCFLAAPLLRRFPAVLVVALLAGLSLLVEGAGYVRQGDFFYYLIYFYCGDFIARSQWDLATRWKRWGLAVSALSLAAIAVLVTRTDLETTWLGYLPFVLGSLPLIVLMAMSIARTPLAKPLVYAGRHSIVFYLVHFTLFIALIHVIEKFTRHGGLIFGLLLLAGIAVPAVISFLRQRETFAFIDVLFSMRAWRPKQKAQAPALPEPA